MPAFLTPNYWQKRLKNAKERLQRAKRRKLRYELLEDRRLLATVTIITHGFQLDVDSESSYPVWPVSMGEAILDVSDGEATSRSKGSIFKSDPTSGSWMPIGSWNNSNQRDQDVVLLFDWVDESDKFQDGWLEAAADSLFASLTKQNQDLGGTLAGTSFLDVATQSESNVLDIHFIGHSRGAVLNSLVTQRIAANFPTYLIDQVTSLDPHPAQLMSDPGYNSLSPNDSTLATGVNVVFADNYYRKDGTILVGPIYENDLDFDGVVADRAHNLKLSESVLGDNTGSLSEHSDVSYLVLWDCDFDIA